MITLEPGIGLKAIQDEWVRDEILAKSQYRSKSFESFQITCEDLLSIFRKWAWMNQYNQVEYVDWALGRDYD